MGELSCRSAGFHRRRRVIPCPLRRGDAFRRVHSLRRVHPFRRIHPLYRDRRRFGRLRMIGEGRTRGCVGGRRRHPSSRLFRRDRSLRFCNIRCLLVPGQSLWYPVCIFGCIAFDNLCKWVNKAQDSIMAKMQKKKKRHTIGLFEYVGQNALIFYVSHYILFRITFDWIARYNSKWYSGWEGLMIITFIYAIVIFPICRFLNHRDVKNSINEGK